VSRWAIQHNRFLTGCRQRYQVSLSEAKYDAETLFKYGEDDLCEVIVQGVVHGEDAPDKAQDLEPPTTAQLLTARRYKIHAGYYGVLLGFLREIHLVNGDGVKGERSLFRAIYLLKILDHFAKELPGITVDTRSRWRSRALNPILQRQLRGVSDQEAGMVKAEVGKTLEAAVEFYLVRDPICPESVRWRLRNILYVFPVRWSLGHLKIAGSQENYDDAYEATTRLLSERVKVSDEDFEGKVLCEYELEVIEQEQLKEYYVTYIMEAVRCIHLGRNPSILMSLV
jgi:hypothetical protein